MTQPIDVSKARVYYPDGRVAHYNCPRMAAYLYLTRPRTVSAVFRDAGSTEPVLETEFVPRKH